MSRFEKLIKKIFSDSQISYQEIETLLLRLGFDLEISGSHHVFRKPGMGNISLKKRPILLSYQIKIVKEALVKHGYTKKKYKDLDYYLNLSWTYTVETAKEDGSKIYIVYVNELPGICTDAPTIEEAMQNIQEAMIGAFKLYMKHGEDIPKPRTSKSLSITLPTETPWVFKSKSKKIFKEIKKSPQKRVTKRGAVKKYLK